MRSGQFGQRSFAFGGLPFARVEVENLVAALPDITQFMNDRVSRSLVEPLMDSHTIVDYYWAPFILIGNGL